MELHLVSSLILTLIVIVYLRVYSQNIYQENFEEEDDAQPGKPDYCQDCNRRGRKGVGACLSCNNCGWCVDPNGYGSCVLGDYNGPYFADCAQYMYNGGITAAGGAGGVPYGPGGGQYLGPGSGASPFGPAKQSWYQMLFVPWYGGTGPGAINPSPDYIGNSFYNNYSPLKNPRRWRPTGMYRTMA